MGSGGGTQMHCPGCNRITVCRAPGLSHLGLPSAQRWRRIGHDDVQWFRRGRECLSCGRQFVTAELNEDRVDELVELRNALGDVKRNAERYVASAREAAEALGDLTASLEVLRALDVYQDMPRD